ncbi:MULTISPECIES: NAD(P)/FAD-dependent oxidoreductase [Clostridium]|jgi:Predicted dehydrogenase|uniref:NAD(P)/FAD-dependent oxidoreductase n=2 Tax=Clostridium beijerinckii TaxID=1520 RepID=A0A1S8RU89_CLOBE|nr:MULTISPECIES: NAD(P)/FAD-dependent oxidoreductase [Clostridium]ABR36617.1 FAD dependent oxidoreductase [Clostridium beijerinckii NCIMB 8052]AIU02241.1 FAD dependent oxidoreductase [Clostridium beijerinckii ATCC 35702]MBE6091351.1 NAD(P)/FAD-dependent oxidoreductase [Clostridium beijerinckii]MBF7808738.1 NAD(P)/FAD-dependent oxidoreductase [Clostridium beijerinckii]NOW89218.1 glycerol-3-phosphate dehydrogenase [Clostridium beijerinckii]
MYDVAIIGSGVIGNSIFRELTKYNLKVVVLEKEKDVSMGTSKANSAIVHAGYDPKEGTLMAKYNVAGNEMFEDLCKELSVPFKRNGSLIIAFNDEDMKTVQALYENGTKIGVKDLQILSKEQVLEKEPNLNQEIFGALYAPTGGIVGPFEYTIALAENAVANGGEIKLEKEVVAIEKNDTFKITTKDGEIIESKFVINAAGLYADKIHNLVCKESFKIVPRSGEYFVMDKTQGNVVSHTIFQCPSKLGKGVLVTPTVHGNLLVGPDARDIEDKDDVGTLAEGLNEVRDASMRTTNKVNFREIIRSFAGLRANPDTGDFIVEENDEVKGFIDVAGMKSPGLSSAPAIALDVVEILKESGCKLDKKSDFKAKREQIHFMELSAKEKAELIKKNPQYGRMVCRCESITEGEIVDAIKRSIGIPSLDSIKRRCRPGMGRCQGGFCGPRVQEIIARECNVPLEDVVQEKSGSYILLGKTK